MKVAYFQGNDGREPVRTYIDAVEDAGRFAEAARIHRTIALVEAAEHPEDLRSLRIARLIDRTNRIWELLPGRHRIAFATVSEVIVLLHAWPKKGQKLSKPDLQTAQRRLRALRE